MPIYPINEILKETVLNALDKAQSGLFALDVKIYSSENPDPEHIVEPMFIDLYTIAQDFTTTYTDLVAISMQLEPEDFLKVYQNYQNLYCTLYAYPVPESTKLPDYNLHQTYQNNEEFLADIDNVITTNEYQIGFTHTYKAVILGIEDILKSINPNEILSTELNQLTDELRGKKIPLALQLMTEDTYSMSKKGFNGTLTNCTVEQAILTTANALGITNVTLVPPDNTTIHKQIIIPPVQKIDTFLQVLQDDPGIYAKGLGYYYSNNTLYIYPAYETQPNRDQFDNVIHIYKIPENTFPGLYGYHSYDDNDNLHIVSDTSSTTEDTSTKSLETKGNQTITFNTNQMLDVQRQVDNSTCKFSDNNFITVNMENTQGNTKDTYTINYVKGTNNPYKLTSDLAQDNRTKVTLGWHNPIPYLINPGQRCIYHYENQQGYYTQLGIIDSVIYLFQKSTRTFTYIYNGEATITLRLDPDSEMLMAPNPDTSSEEDKSNQSSSTISNLFSSIGDISLSSLKNLFS